MASTLRAQFARPQHPCPCLRKVRREIVTGNVDEAAHVLVTIAEHRRRRGCRRPARAQCGCAREAAISTDETTTLRPRAPRRTRRAMSRRLTWTELMANDCALKCGDERIESHRKRNRRTETSEGPWAAAACLLNVTRRHRQFRLERACNGRRRTIRRAPTESGEPDDAVEAATAVASRRRRRRSRRQRATDRRDDATPGRAACDAVS